MKLSKKRPIVYYPPEKEVLEQYAKTVCQTLADKQGNEYGTSDFRDDFTTFIKLVVKAKLKYLNGKPFIASSQMK